MACLAMASNAQQALWGGPEITSPVINSDGSVTFALLAPQAQSVLVTGDFLPEQKVTTPFGEATVPGTAALERDTAGVWTCTTAALPSELYSYNFIVDGVKVADPANVYSIRDVASVTSTLIVPGDREALYGVHNVPHGSLTRTWYHSATMGHDRRITVYTPAGYDSNQQQRYPVLYLLHGMGGDEEAWPALGRTAQILDNLIASGKAKPMIVVMPNGNMAQTAAPGESSEGLKKPSFNLPYTMEGTFETAFPEIVAWTDARYRTVAQKSGRAIAGLSMGGFHSLHISKQYPGTFDYVGLFSAAILPRQQELSPIYADFDAKLAQQFAQKPALYWIGIGKTDFLYQANADYRAKLDAQRYPYVYLETEGGHIWRNWRIYLAEFAQLLFK